MVRGFAKEISLELISRGVKGIVIACNTASSASLPELAKELPVPVWGVVDPGIEAAKRISQGKVGLLATPGTIKTRSYQDRLSKLGCKSGLKPARSLCLLSKKVSQTELLPG